MMGALVLHVLWISVVVALAAWLAERALRSAGMATRGVWFAALVCVPLLAVVLPALVPVWTASPDGVVAALRLADIDVPGPPVLALADSADRDRVVARIWLALSVAWYIAVLGLAAYFRIASRTWHRMRVDGHDVRLSPDVGPGVIGWLRPMIVLPGWVLGWDRSDRAFVLRHEAQHLAARDPQLLCAALLVAGAMPWNPVVWWCVARLREAIEVDCDARVVQQLGRPDRYGALLLRLAAADGISHLAVTGFAPRSSLETRLRQIVRVRRPPGPVLLTLGVLLLITGAAVAASPGPNEAGALREPLTLFGMQTSPTNAGPKRVLPPGALPGSPTEDELQAAIRDNLRRFGPLRGDGERMYVIADAVGNVLRTGRAPGDEQEAVAFVARRYPGEVGEFQLLFESVEEPRMRVTWLIAPAALR